MKILLLTAGLCCLGMMFAAAAEKPKPAEAKKVLKHMVMYSFKTSTTPKQIDEVVNAFAALPEKIDVITGFEKGTNVSEEGKSEGFTHVFVVTFPDEAARAVYLKHPAHDAYVAVVKDRREKVVVFDYWTHE